MTALGFLSHLVAQTRALSLPALISLAVGFALHIVFAIQTPIGGDSRPGYLCAYNDEIAHANYALHISLHGTLPSSMESIQASGALERGNYEHYQPPLYYALIGSLFRISGVSPDIETIIYACRIFSLFLFLGLLIVGIFLADALELPSSSISTALIFLSLSGVLVRFTSMATNDGLFWLGAGAMFYAALRIRMKKGSAASLGLFAFWTILALYTKASTLLLLPLLFVPILEKRSLILPILIAFFIIAVSTLPIWLRNVNEFGGLLPLSSGFGTPVWRWPGVDSLLYAVRSFIFPWSEFWSGWIGALFILPAAAVILVGMMRSPLRKDVLILTAIFSAFAGYLWLNLRYDQAEGRYLFVAWPAIVLLVSTSLHKAGMQWILAISLTLPYLLFLFPTTFL